MAEYIRSVSPALQQAILQAQAMKAENKTRSTQNIAGAVAAAINDYYKDKEMKIQQAKENKLKESLALLEFAKNYETTNLPAGVRGVPQGGIQPFAPSIGAAEQISMPGYQPVPEALRAIGVTGQMFRPREQAAQMLVTPEQHAAALTAYKDKPEIVKKLTTTTQPGMKYNDFVKAVQVATKEEPLPKPPVSRDIKTENDLRKEFDSLTKDFRAVKSSYTRVKASTKEPTAAGDLALIYNYMKMLDPTSVVRESEFATAAGTGAFGEKIKAAVNKVVNGERLSDAIRQDFVSTAEKLYQAQLEQHNVKKQEYKDLAVRYGVKPENVIVGESVSPEKPTPAKAPTPAPAKASPKDDLNKALDELGI